MANKYEARYSQETKATVVNTENGCTEIHTFYNQKDAEHYVKRLNMEAKDFAQEAISWAFEHPTMGSATDVPCGFVPYTMENLRDIAVSLLTNGSPGQWYNGDSYMYQEDISIDFLPNANTIIPAAVAMVNDYFDRCEGKK